MKKLLLVVDYQNDFVVGSLGFPRASSIEEHIVHLVETYHQNKDTVVFTLDTHGKDYLSTREGRNLPVPHCLKGEEGHALFGRLKELAKQDLCIEKKTFGSSLLGEYLSKNPFDEIVIVGVVTSMCVLANAVVAKTYCPEARIVIDARGCADFSVEMEEKTIAILRNLQMEVEGA